MLCLPIRQRPSTPGAQVHRVDFRFSYPERMFTLSRGKIFKLRGSDFLLSGAHVYLKSHPPRTPGAQVYLKSLSKLSVFLCGAEVYLKSLSKCTKLKGSVFLLSGAHVYLKSRPPRASGAQVYLKPCLAVSRGGLRVPPGGWSGPEWGGWPRGQLVCNPERRFTLSR